MEIFDITSSVSEIPGLIMAAMPIAAYFISNWFTVATATYYRVTPTYCIAAMPHMIAQTAVGIVAILITVGFAIRADGLLAMIPWESLAVVAGFIIMVMAIRSEVPPIAFVFLGIGFAFFLIILICWLTGTHIVLLSTYLFTIGKFEFTVEEVLLQIILLCALFFLFGLVDTVLRRDYLVDTENGAIILATFSGDRCLVAKIREIETRTRGIKTRSYCHIAHPYIYETFTNPDRKLSWCRFYRVLPDRKGPEINEIQGVSIVGRNNDLKDELIVDDSKS